MTGALRCFTDACAYPQTLLADRSVPSAPSSRFLARVIVAAMLFAPHGIASGQEEPPVRNPGGPIQAHQPPPAPVWPSNPGSGFLPGGWGADDTHIFDENPGDQDATRDAAEKGCDEQSGNPVVISTGNKLHSALDFAVDAEMGLRLERRYNHYWQHIGLFGRHWTSSLDYSLVFAGPDLIYAQRPDGRRIRFDYNPITDRYEENKPDPVAWIESPASGGWLFHTEDRSIERYNAFGYILERRNRQGIGWTFSYDASNYLQQVTHSNGQSITLQWTPSTGPVRRLTGVTDPAGFTHSYDYELNVFGPNQPRLRSATRPGSPAQGNLPAVPATQVEYHYEDPAWPGGLTGISYGGQRHSHYSYDASGRVVSSAHAGGVNLYSYAYIGTEQPPSNPAPPPPPGGQCDPITLICNQPQSLPGGAEPTAGQRAAWTQAEAARSAGGTLLRHTQVQVTNPLGHVTIHRIERVAGVSRINEVEGLPSTHCAGRIAIREHDSRGYLQRSFDYEGNETQPSFADTGQLESLTEAAGSTEQRQWSYDWHPTLNRIESVTLVGDHRIEYGYHPDERPAFVRQVNLKAGPWGTLPPQQTDLHWQFHANGLPSRMTVDGPLPGAGDAVEYHYNALGFLSAVRNSLGHQISYSQHDGLGRPGRIVDANGAAVEQWFDGQGRLRRQRTFRNGGEQDTLWTWRSDGLLDTLETPDGITESYSYDTARRLYSITRNEADGIRVLTLHRDAAGNVTHETLHRQRSADPAPVLIWQRWTDVDELGRVRARRGNAGQHTRYAYDLNGNLSEIERQPGPGADLTRLDYDALNRLRQQTDAHGGITTFSYDAADRLIRVTDPRAAITEYVYDGFGQLRAQTSPDTGLTTQAWNSAGQRISRTGADGVTMSYGYDALGRLTSIQAGGDTHSYVWDSHPQGCSHGLGRICRIIDPHQDLYPVR